MIPAGRPGVPAASLSLDLDNKWSYLKTHGDPGWETYPSYLNLVVPRILERLKAHALTITVFVVGQDAADPEHGEVLQAIAGAGHEIGNHSFRHEPWLHLYSHGELHHELARAEEQIGGATGKHPVGFRGPGFSMSTTTLRVLAERGYSYDATTFPNALNPLARTYFLATSKLDARERKRRQGLFGTFSDALRPNRPYRWQLGEGTLAEVPVTTLPGLRVPMHFSYILYLSGFSEALARRYFLTALELCRRTGTSPSLLLHPLDFLGREDDRDLGFFPGMELPRAAKLDLLDETLQMLSQRFDVIGVAEHARRAAAGPHVKVRQPRFRHG